MSKRLTFEATDQGRKLFEKFSDAFVFGITLLDDKGVATKQVNPRNKAQYRQHARIQRLIHGASVETPSEKIDARYRPMNGSRTLKDEGATIGMEVADLELMEKCILAVGWSGQDTSDIDELLTLVDGALRAPDLALPANE